jgi:hypothetical protein
MTDEGYTIEVRYGRTVYVEAENESEARDKAQKAITKEKAKGPITDCTQEGKAPGAIDLEEVAE